MLTLPGLQTISFNLFPFLYRRRNRLDEVRWLAQVHTASLPQSWVYIPVPTTCSMYIAFGVHISVGIFEGVCVHMKGTLGV